MAQQFANNAATKLANAITSTATSMTVVAGTGQLFPTLASGDYFYCTLIDPDGNMEIVRVTARSGDVFTIVRNQDATGAKAFPADSDVQQRVTKGTLQDLRDNYRTEYSGVTLNLYVDPINGNNNNDGLTLATALKTMSGLITKVQSLSFSGVAVNINISAGTLNDFVNISLSSFDGAFSVNLIGAGTGQTIWESTSSVSCFAAIGHNNVTVSGITFKGRIVCQQGSNVYVNGDIEFDLSGSFSAAHCLYVNESSVLTVSTGTTITIRDGSVGTFLFVTANSMCLFNGNLVFINTPTIGSLFSTYGSNISFVPTSSITGQATITTGFYNSGLGTTATTNSWSTISNMLPTSTNGVFLDPNRVLLSGQGAIKAQGNITSPGNLSSNNSFGISSVTKTDTGTYVIEVPNSTNYCGVASIYRLTSPPRFTSIAQSETTWTVKTYDSNQTLSDNAFCVIFS